MLPVEDRYAAVLSWVSEDGQWPSLVTERNILGT
jgi:hypothetical protein